jgi:hypothetical protein
MVIAGDVGDPPALACVPYIDQIVAKRHFGGGCCRQLAREDGRQSGWRVVNGRFVLFKK